MTIRRFQAASMFATVAAGLALLVGCVGASGEVELRPDSREGIFYTVYAEAAQEAADQNKLLLIEFWRPG